MEKDWNESVILADGFTVHVLPARHFSGRGLRRNRALWVSFALRTPSMHDQEVNYNQHRVVL